MSRTRVTNGATSGCTIEVCKFSNVLKNNGVKKGDRVCIYMPIFLEAVVAMLCCARIGAVHSVVFGGFSLISRVGFSKNYLFFILSIKNLLTINGVELIILGCVFGMNYKNKKHQQKW